MTTLLKLHPVYCADIGRAISCALEYRGRLPEVWIVRVGQGDYMEVCQPTTFGGRPAPGAVEVAMFENTGHNGAGPYFRVVFGPGVMKFVEGNKWVGNLEDSSEKKAPSSPENSSETVAGV